MSDISIIEKELQNGTLLPQGSIHGTVWSVRDGLKIEFTSDDENAEKSVTLDSDVILFFWDYEGTRPVWMHKTHLNGNVLLWKYDASIWRVMNLLKVESVRLGVAYLGGSEACCMYIRNNVLAEDDLPENKYAVSMLDEKDNTVLSAGWTGNGFLSVKVRARNSFVQQFYLAEVSGYKYENRHFIIFVELPLVDGTVSLTLGKDIDKKFKVSENSFYTIEEKSCTSISRILKIDFDMEAISRLLDVEGEELCLLPEVVVENQYFPLVATESVLDDRIYDISENHKASLRRNSDGRLKVICADEIYDVLLSVVTAVYNTAPFLSEMIESVLSQKLDKLNKYIKDKFRDVFEFILVDDGSTDGSGEILDNYARMFDCIKVVHKENGGVSSARNTGLEIARGKYVNFADSDDKLANNFMEECLLFFEEHEHVITLITTPMCFFDAKNGQHWTDYKFKQNNSIIDLRKESDVFIYFVCSSIFKHEDMKEVKFQTSLVNGEDIRFVYEIINNTKPVVGAVSQTHYDYRRRSTGELSAIQASSNDTRSYTDYLKNVLGYSLNISANEDGYIPRYVQEMVMGQLQWRFNIEDKGKKGKEILGEEAYSEYKEYAIGLLNKIDAEVILNAKKIWNEVKYYALKKKFNINPTIEEKNGLHYFFIADYKINTAIEEAYIRMEFMEIRNNVLHIEGYAMCFEPETELLVYVNDVSVPFEEYPHDTDKYCFDDICFYSKTFIVDIVLNDNVQKYVISFSNVYDGVECEKKNFRYSKTMPLAQTYEKSYYQSSNWTIRREGKNFVVRNRFVDGEILNYEKEFCDEVRNKKRLKNVEYMLNLRYMAIQQLALRKRSVWILSDRVNVAGDNGEALFRYIKTINDNNVEAYFLLERESDDFKKMQQYGNVISRDSESFYLLQLTADFIVSSAADEYVINPWFEDKESAEIVRDLLARSKFIFLQHGVIKDDMSMWLNRYNKKITGFICTAPREAQSILDCDYHYKDENVWLTGLPRHDLLYHDERKWIVIMPTWRQALQAYSGTENALIKNFTDSRYFHFYDELINNHRLLEAAARTGYTICFMPHPGIKRHGLKFFHKNPNVKFLNFDYAYKDVYAWANLIMTDYSSSVMDFALLRKPIVYCQFDKDDFFENHIYTQGYYDYEKDGFGEVTYDMDSCIDVIIRYMEDGCKVHEPYGSRMENFFRFHDKNNCARVYDRIMGVSK